MHKTLSQLLDSADILLFFEEKLAPKSPVGARLPFTVDLSKTFRNPKLVREIADHLAVLVKEYDAKQLLALTPVMRPYVALASEKAGLPFCEYDADNRAVIGGGKRSDPIMLIGERALGNEYGQEMIAALEKISLHVADLVFLFDFLPKGDEYEIARRKLLLRENMTLHVLLPMEEWLLDGVKRKSFSEDLAEHCIQYLHNPKRLSKDPLWWMKYHELLARNRII